MPHETNGEGSLGGLPNENELEMGNPQTEYIVLMRLVRMLDERIDEIRRTLPAQVQTAAKEAMEDHILTTEERDFLRVMIEKQRQSVLFRRAVIEKTTTALVWSGIVILASTLFTLFKEYAQTHGMWKP